jgi:hypothetical protein
MFNSTSSAIWCFSRVISLFALYRFSGDLVILDCLMKLSAAEDTRSFFPSASEEEADKLETSAEDRRLIEVHEHSRGDFPKLALVLRSR